MLLTVDEAVEYLKLSRPTLARMVREGALPVVRLRGRRVLFRREALDELIERAEHRGSQGETR